MKVWEGQDLYLANQELLLNPVRIPEKSLKTGYIEIDKESCKDCRLCVYVCPHHLIVPSLRMNQKGYCPVDFSETQLRKEERKCTGCSLCAISCPEVAIEVYRA
jgi:2-oxoglutarate ferredoxin oxidoreductase subunit delta